MDAMLFLKSALIGLSIAAPVGPIGLLCIQRTLAHGAKIGFVSGLGAAAADGAYGVLGAFGLASITQIFVTLATPLATGWAIFLGWMGLQLLRAEPARDVATASDAVHPARAFGSVFALTLTNPMTILSFVAVFAAIGGSATLDAASAGWMVLGVFCGSALWWLLLAGIVATVRHRIGVRAMRAINGVAGAFLLGLAGWQLAGLLS